MKRKIPEPSKERLEVIRRIQENEEKGGEWLFHDVEPDPPSHPLTAEEVDYPGKRFSTRFKRFIARNIIRIIKGPFYNHFKMEFVGVENIRDIKGGAIITSNHFGKWENISADRIAALASPKRRVSKIVREGNFFIPGIVGFLLKYGDTMPLSSSPRTMIALDREISARLSRGEFILVYPEQAMWWNYRKPRSYRAGAFKFAAKNNVPIIPIFVTLSDLPQIDSNGFRRQKYTIHISKPIYPDPSKNTRENTQEMLELNHKICEDIYTEAYGCKPEYACGEIPIKG